jgi:translation initiation factor IF-1
MNLSLARTVEVEGRIVMVLPGILFRVELDNQQLVLATVSSKMWQRWVRLVVGDRVRLEMVAHDPDHARITWRLT